MASTVPSKSGSNATRKLLKQEFCRDRCTLPDAARSADYKAIAVALMRFKN